MDSGGGGNGFFDGEVSAYNEQGVFIHFLLCNESLCLVF